MASEGRPGRPEGPLDPTGGAVADLAARLRQLRQDAGRPSYRQLARSAYYSHSALSQAAAGRVLPSLAVTLAFVQACGGDRQEWIALWHEAALEAGVPAEPDDHAVGAGLLTDTRPAADAAMAMKIGAVADAGPVAAARHGLRGLLGPVRQRWLPLATAGVAALAGVLAWWGLSAGLTTLPGGPTAPAAAGDPSAVNYCTSSWVNLDSRQVVGEDGQVLGRLALRYSKRCGTAWGRFSPASSFSPARGVTITVEVVRRPDGMTLMSQELFVGHLLSQELPLPRGGCALASVTVASPGQAPAHAVTGCQPPP